MLKSRQIIKKM